MYLSYRGIEAVEESPLCGLGAVDTNAIIAAGSGLLTDYFNVQTAKTQAKAAKAAAKAEAAQAARAQSALNRWLVAGAVVGGTLLLALVVVAATRKGN